MDHYDSRRDAFRPPPNSQHERERWQAVYGAEVSRLSALPGYEAHRPDQMQWIVEQAMALADAAQDAFRNVSDPNRSRRCVYDPETGNPLDDFTRVVGSPR